MNAEQLARVRHMAVEYLPRMDVSHFGSFLQEHATCAPCRGSDRSDGRLTALKCSGDAWCEEGEEEEETAGRDWPSARRFWR